MSRLKDVIQKGTQAGRPAAGIEGRLYYNEDVGQLERDSGIAWEAVESAVAALGDLSDVDLATPPTDGQALSWNDTDAEWEPADVAGGGHNHDADYADIAHVHVIDDLSDVDTATVPPTVGQVLTWDNVASLWEPADASGGATSLDELSDVDVTTTPPTDGQALIYDAVGGEWIPGDVAAGAGGAGLGTLVRRTTGQAISSSVDTAISFDTEDQDDLDAFDGGTPTRLTIPSDGWYIVSIAVNWSNTTNSRYSHIRLNGTDFLSSAAGNMSDLRHSASLIRYCFVNDYIELIVFSAGSAATVDGAVLGLAQLGGGGSGNNDDALGILWMMG